MLCNCRAAELLQAQSEVAALRLRLAEFERDHEELLRVRRQEAAARHKLKALEWDHEVINATGCLRV